MTESIIVHAPDGGRRTIPADADAPLSRVLFLAGFLRGLALCAGLGRCGLCRVRYRSPAPEPTRRDTARLGEAAVAEGWRLACLHLAAPCEVELPEIARAEDAERFHWLDDPDGAPLALGVDLGTTSVAWRAVALEDEGLTRAVAHGSAPNPQQGLGSEVMTRLALAADPDGAAALRDLAGDWLAAVARRLDERGGRVAELCVAGNPAMTALMLGADASGLSRAPYRLDEPGGAPRPLPGAAGELLPPAWIPPQYGPFVGGDAAAGLAALLLAQDAAPEYPFLLMDLGTNGEFLLVRGPDDILAASAPMGPALEGVGLSHGRLAGPGVATGFELTPAGLVPVLPFGPHAPTPDAVRPVGVSGTGHLSLAALLLDHGLLDAAGHFRESGATPLARRLSRRLETVSGEAAFRMPGGLHLTATDVEELLKVKAAANAAVARLLTEAGMAPREVARVHLAGAFGRHVSVRALARLGFLPPELEQRTVKAGNTALAGAVLLASFAAVREELAALGPVRVLDLAADPAFAEDYVQRMVPGYV